MQDDHIVDVFQDRTDRVQQQQGCPLPEQGGVVEDRE